MADTDITKATATTETASKMEGTASENEYGSSNTNDYSQNITDQYTQFVQDYDAATEAAVQNATSQLERIRAVGERTAEENAQMAKQDSEELRRTRRAMEQNEGNRQRIGESQYGVAENAYDQQMAVIESVKNKLRTDTARQVADLRAQGDYASANAALETAQAQFRQLYEEGLRVSGNLRSNYEYQTELQREDEAIAREQDSEELDWKRSMGEFMLKHGVMPTDEILAALGIDSSAAQLYINAVSSGYYSGGSGSGSSGGTTYKSSQEILDDLTGDLPDLSDENEEPDGLPFGLYSDYNKDIAERALAKAAAGDLVSAWGILTDNAAYLSEANYGLLVERAAEKYDTYIDNYYKGYTGGGSANNYGAGTYPIAGSSSSSSGSSSSTSKSSGTSSKSSTSGSSSGSTSTIVKPSASKTTTTTTTTTTGTGGGGGGGKVLATTR